MSYTLNGEQLVQLCNLIGIECNEGEEAYLSTEITISKGSVMDELGGKIIYEGLYAYLTDYPEEGCFPLEEYGD